MGKTALWSSRGGRYHDRRGDLSFFRIWVCRFGLFLISLGVILIAMTEADAARPMQAVQAFNQAVHYFNDSKYEDAIPYFEKAIDRDSEFAEAYFGRAACKHAQ